MLLLRLLGFLLLLTIGGCFVMFLLRGDRRYLRLAGQILRYSVVLAAIIMAFYLAERLLLVL